MGSYLGIDAHSKTGLELAAIDAEDGKLLWRDRCRLDAKRLQHAVQRAPSPSMVVVEQGELATWLHMTLSGVCDELFVADPRHNRIISTSPDKSDAFDALALAELGRGGYLREVFQPPERFAVLRLRVRHHYRLGRHVTRLKNQVKACYRVQGIPVSGTGVYSFSGRARWLKRMPGPARLAAEDLYALLDVAQQRKQAAVTVLGRAVRRFGPAKRLLQVPEIGPVRASTFVGYLVTPDRFPSRKHVWSYCGFGLTRRSTGHHTEPVRLRNSYSRHLKRTIKSTVNKLIEHPGDPFAAAYQVRLQRGMLPSRAKLALARKLIDVLCALWIKEEDYDPKRIKVV